MKTGHGVIQVYNGVAAGDGKHQVVVSTEGYGQGQEHGLLEPMIEGLRQNLDRDGEEDVLSEAKLQTDSGYHSRKTLEHLQGGGIDGYIADIGFRSRAPRFKNAERHNTQGAVQAKVDFGHHIYSMRLGILERGFSNIREAIGLRCFSLRRTKKLDRPWKRMTMLHNIFTIHHYGWTAQGRKKKRSGAESELEGQKTGEMPARPRTVLSGWTPARKFSNTAFRGMLDLVGPFFYRLVRCVSRTPRVFQKSDG